MFCFILQNVVLFSNIYYSWTVCNTLGLVNMLGGTGVPTATAGHAGWTTQAVSTLRLQVTGRSVVKPMVAP